VVASGQRDHVLDADRIEELEQRGFGEAGVETDADAGARPWMRRPR
jgi:hypothetical protein